MIYFIIKLFSFLNVFKNYKLSILVKLFLKK